MPSVEFERVSSDLLTVEKWWFYFDDRTFRLVLDVYIKAEKRTRRHAFRNVAVYTRLDRRNNTITLDAVPFDDEIAHTAYNTFVEQIKVVKE
jgi:hypothetical protein